MMKKAIAEAPARTSHVEMEPLGDKVLLEMIPHGRTAAGLILPEGVQINLPRARVLAVGPGKWVSGVFVPTTVKVGDVVLADGSGGYNVRKNVALLSCDLIIARVPDVELEAAAESGSVQ